MTSLLNLPTFGGAFTRVGPPSGGWVGWHSDTAELRTDLPRVAGRVAAMVADGSGGWFIGGEFSAVEGVARSNLAHIRADRTLNPAWAPQADKPIRAMALNGTTLYLGGEFTAINGLPRTGFAALNAANGELAGLNPTISHPSTLVVNTLAISGNTLFVGGMFTQIAATPRNYLAAVNASSGVILSAFNANIAQGLSQRVSVILKGDGVLYFGGQFTTVGVQPRLCAAAVDRENGNTLYVGGSFTQLKGSPRNRLAAVNVTTGALLPWNPNVTGPIFPGVSDLSLLGETLYFAGIYLLPIPFYLPLVTR